MIIIAMVESQKPKRRIMIIIALIGSQREFNTTETTSTHMLQKSLRILPYTIIDLPFDLYHWELLSAYY